MLSCTGGGAGADGAECPLGGAAYSEVPLLISPALRTLFGRLPRGAGDAAPPVVVDPGRLSPTRLLIRDSISRRLSALPGEGDTSSPGLLMLWRPANAWLARSSLCRFSSASFAFLARISSRRCCIMLFALAHHQRRTQLDGIPSRAVTRLRCFEFSIWMPWEAIANFKATSYGPGWVEKGGKSTVQ